MYDNSHTFPSGEEYFQSDSHGRHSGQHFSQMSKSVYRQQSPPPPSFPSHHQPNYHTSEMDYHRSIVAASNNAPSTVFPRSASEAMFDASSKFRQLPCRTFISVGTCPYRERCVYLHDPRCICKEAKTKTRRKNKEDVVLDALFWPVMPYPMVAAKLDMNRQPHVIQSYSVPLPQSDQYHQHDAAVYSMWMHFVDFCLATSESATAMLLQADADSCSCYSAPDEPINSYTEKPRLVIFQVLSRRNGAPLASTELLDLSSLPPGQLPPLPAGTQNPQQQQQQQQQQQNQPQNQPQHDDGNTNSSSYGGSSGASAYDGHHHQQHHHHHHHHHYNNNDKESFSSEDAGPHSSVFYPHAWSNRGGASSSTTSAASTSSSSTSSSASTSPPLPHMGASTHTTTTTAPAPAPAPTGSNVSRHPMLVCNIAGAGAGAGIGAAGVETGTSAGVGGLSGASSKSTSPVTVAGMNRFVVNNCSSNSSRSSGNNSSGIRLVSWS